MEAEKKTVLYIDDEQENLLVFKSTFRHEFSVMVAESAKQGLYFLRQTKIDLIISDHKMPDKSGIDFLTEMANEYPDISRILITAYSEPNLIISSLNNAHVFGYVAKPWKKPELLRLMQSGIQSTELKRQNRELVLSLIRSNDELTKANARISKLMEMTQAENTYLRSEIISDKGSVNMIGESNRLKEVKTKIRQVAPLVTTVLIEGETGTGKELVARAIHELSGRNAKPFIKLNCASLPISLVESELFGYEKGAFTGALGNKPGLLEIADNGTLFLDEIGELPMEVQPKLLRVLQEGEFFKVGSSKPINVDVRIVAATNRVLKDEVKKGTFRSDLFFRLNVFPIFVPPLRERKEDIPQLFDFFIKKYQRKLGIKAKEIIPSLVDSLMQHNWPGNIRELEGVVERSLILSQGNSMKISLSVNPSDTQETDFTNKLLPLRDMERQYIIHILNKVDGKIAGRGGAAELLKINHNTLRSKMMKYHIKFRRK